VLLAVIFSLVLLPVSNSVASNLTHSGSHLQTTEMSHSIAMQHHDQKNVTIHDSEEMAGHNSPIHDCTSIGDCCSACCSPAIVVDVRSKTTTELSKSYILPTHSLLLPSEWDTHLRPPKPEYI